MQYACLIYIHKWNLMNFYYVIWVLDGCHFRILVCKHAFFSHSLLFFFNSCFFSSILFRKQFVLIVTVFFSTVIGHFVSDHSILRLNSWIWCDYLWVGCVGARNVLYFIWHRFHRKCTLWHSHALTTYISTNEVEIF